MRIVALGLIGLSLLLLWGLILLVGLVLSATRPALGSYTPRTRLLFAVAAGLLIFTLGIVDLARRDVE